MVRNTQWIKAIEFYDHHIPIIPFENKYFNPEVLFEDSNSIVRTSQFKDLYLGEIYNLNKILDRLENEDAEINPFIELKMLPIAEGV